MGLLKAGLRTANAIITLGGSLELEHAKASFESTHASYKITHDEITQIKTKIDNRISELGDTLKTVKARLEHIEKLLETTPLSFDKQSRLTMRASQSIERFNQQYSGVLNVGFGGIVGGSMALGAWALVSAIGTASTGTAIGTLSGVAASNATLAWFGGGALAAGGAGMSGGMLVLGGIVAAPIIYFAAKGAWTKARAFQEQEALVAQEHEKLRVLKPELEKQYNDVLAYTAQLNRHCHTWLEQMDTGLAILYPWGKFSIFYRDLLHIIGIKWKRLEHLMAIETMNQQTVQFLRFFQNENTPPAP
ncbi:hypothetical protein CWS43_18615 [Rahnella sp. AA]|uniref:hypothetical protein n=1 Tax=Rahnella sp. AA TaxID=2057180 RepID=UPI000C336F79|nr:hypothetical protein [Rahnella sp. AA]PKE28866.1 hypothetical protein CWS43_18615 [Rahnella sp. AA]